MLTQANAKPKASKRAKILLPASPNINSFTNTTFDYSIYCLTLIKNNMKKIISIFFLAIIYASGHAQPGSTCMSAITLIPASTCSFSTFSTSGTSMYFGFVATSPTVDIVVSTTKFGIDAPHIHHIALLGGTCSSPTVLAEDELPFDFNADQLTINLNASALIVGNTYFIKVDREATFIVCNKAGCTTGGSTAPALFNICIQNINVIIPADFGLETPNTTYSYLTNRGQLLDVNSNLVPNIKLYTLHANPNIYIANDKVSYVFSHVDTIPSTVDSMQRVDMTLVGASTSTKVFKTETAPGKINFFLPHIPDGIVNISFY